VVVYGFGVGANSAISLYLSNSHISFLQLTTSGLVWGIFPPLTFFTHTHSLHGPKQIIM
jgi:hypothetical protein